MARIFVLRVCHQHAEVVGEYASEAAARAEVITLRGLLSPDQRTFMDYVIATPKLEEPPAEDSSVGPLPTLLAD